MAADKKNRGALIHFALPMELGRMHRTDAWTTPVAVASIEAALAVLE
jgi:hypothetical protein